jgi:hypothetical protein
MSINQNSEDFSDRVKEVLKIQKKLPKNLFQRIFLIFKNWCSTLKNPDEIIKLLWGYNRKIMPFSHKIDGNEPDFSIEKDIHQKGYGLDGLLEIKDKARRIRKDDLLDYIIRQDYLKYLKYCMEIVNESKLIPKLIIKLRRLTILFEIYESKEFSANNSLKKLDLEIIKEIKLYSNEIFDKILAILVDYALDCLKTLLCSSSKPIGHIIKSSKSQLETDLHIHSHYSDCSSQSVGEIICRAEEIGLKTISVTDHNSFEGVCKAIKIGSIFHINVIPGIEVATGIKKSNNWVEDRRDILVYFPDLEKFQKWALNGFDLYTNNLLSKATDRIHNKIYWGNVPVEEVIKWADAHDGISILAHVGYYNYEEKKKVVELLRNGLKGIEIFNMKYHNYPHYGKNSLEEVIEIFLDMIRSYINTNKSNEKPIVTIGSDSHSLDSIGSIELKSQLIKKINLICQFFISL